MSKYNPETDNWSVYIHTVPKEVTGYEYDKYYVGITSKPVENRWQNGHGYKGQVFYNAIEKYGWDNIKHQVVAKYLSQEDACDLERLLVFLYQSNTHDYGYNASIGGEYSALGYEHTDKAKRSISEHTKEMWSDPEKRNKLMTTVLRGKSHKRSREVILLNTLERFDNAHIASETYGILYASFANYCALKTICPIKDEKGRNLIWMYYDKYLETSKEDLDRMLTFTRTSDFKDVKRTDPYVCLNNGDVVYYNTDLPKKYHTTYFNVQKCCNGEIKSAGYITIGSRLTWSYYSEYVNMSEDEIQARISSANYQGYGFRKEQYLVIDLFTMKIYKSSHVCADELGLSSVMIYKSMMNKVGPTHPLKGRFMYFKDFLIHEESYSEIKARETMVLYWTQIQKGEEIYYGAITQTR